MENESEKINRVRRASHLSGDVAVADTRVDIVSGRTLMCLDIIVLVSVVLACWVGSL